MNADQIFELAQGIKHNVNQVIVGKEHVIDLLLVALFASGHVLIDDVPGTGKTLLAKTLAKSLDCTFHRIQFTPDLLPTDISGINYFNPKTAEFQFRPGPVFTHIVLADEINRATPRTQSSLLECMEERQVTVDGETRRLERPFFVIATQNPIENQGTFPLPEAQLDRFLLKVSMGYPVGEEGFEILKRFKEVQPLESISSVADAAQIRDAQDHYSRIPVHDDLLRYLLQIVENTRSHPDIAVGASPRASQALLKAVQVYAILQGRDFVTPDDIQAMAKPVLAHRLVLKGASRLKERGAESILNGIIQGIHVPAEASAIRE